MSAEDTRQADFLRHRFSDTLRPALAEWLASAPEGTIPEGTPFELPTYELAAARQATAFLSRADQHPAASREANQTGDNYILATVQVAAVLFSAGVSTKFPTAGVRRAVLGLGVVVWVVALGIVLALSRSIGF